MKKKEIIARNCYEFEEWFKLVEPSMQETMRDFFDRGDKRNKIIEKVIRKEKLKRIYDNNNN